MIEARLTAPEARSEVNDFTAAMIRVPRLSSYHDDWRRRRRNVNHLSRLLDKNDARLSLHINDL